MRARAPAAARNIRNHLFFPTADAEPKPQPESLDEKAFVPQQLPQVAAGDRVTLHLERGTHIFS